MLGAIALGREIRKLSLNTTVGRVVDLAGYDECRSRAPRFCRAPIVSRCAPSCCSAGVQRIVPPEARVMVHQIWLGDRREDPTAANYSAEDLVLVQRDIGRLAHYTAEMGASIDLLDLALRIPPWEPMHAMTRDELRNTKLATDDAAAPAAADGRRVACAQRRRSRLRASPTACAPARSARSAGPWSIAPAQRRWRGIIRSPSKARTSAASIWCVACGAGSASYRRELCRTPAQRRAYAGAAISWARSRCGSAARRRRSRWRRPSGAATPDELVDLRGRTGAGLA